tara:strand:- start:5 stop:736 length:732 start_codon:yes stop_codon:yes gene_type:complete
MQRIVCITGASQGIGKETAIAFSQAGATVVLASRNKEKLTELAQQLPGETLIVPTDVTKEKDILKLFKTIEEKYERLDILINNAGVVENRNVENISLKEWNKVININLTGVFLCSREAIKLMKKKDVKGQIITISSLLAFIGMSGRSSYCASKHAVSGFMKSLRKEAKKDNITVNTIHPAGVNTPMLQEFTKSRQLGLTLEAHDIAKYIVILARKSFLQRALARIHLIGKRFYYIAQGLVGKS